jgi:hypothetical protein
MDTGLRNLPLLQMEARGHAPTPGQAFMRPSDYSERGHAGSQAGNHVQSFFHYSRQTGGGDAVTETVQLRIIQDPGFPMEFVEAKGTPLPAPEYRPWHGDPRIRIPMKGWLYRNNNHIKILVSFDMPKTPPIEEVKHEIQFCLEKLNMALSTISTQALDNPISKKEKGAV